MATKLKSADIVIVGLGWTGAFSPRSSPTLASRLSCWNAARRATPIRISCTRSFTMSCATRSVIN